MRSIKLLFFIAFPVNAMVGCSTLFGPEHKSAPVETASILPGAAAEADTSAPKPNPQSKLSTPAKLSSPAASTPPTLSGKPSASPDALFVALAALGIDYRYGGRSPTTGFDCSGLVAHIYRDAYGLNLPTHTTAQSRLGKPIDVGQLETGDLVFYNTQGQPNTHVGIYIGDDRFIHAPRTGAAVRIENMRGNYWKTRYNGARRIVF